MPLTLPSLTDTRLGLHLSSYTSRVESLGAWQQLEAGAHLCREGCHEQDLMVLVDGRVTFPGGWLGPGAHVGELAFLLNVPRTTSVVAAEPCQIWRCSANALAQDPAAATMLLTALVRELPARIRKFEAPAEVPDNFCDHDHPAIVRMAQALRGRTAEESARNVWDYVRRMPYRFGPWWIRASETLQLGLGMCTTKSNLQVALWRALGFKAGFTELVGDATLLQALIPARWHHRVSPRVRHFMGTVWLDDRWHVAEASFTDPTLDALVQRFPAIHPLRPLRFGTGQPFFPIAPVIGCDPFSLPVVPDLDHAMARRSSYDLDQLELLNLTNDQLQHPPLPENSSIEHALRLVQHDPDAAFLIALGAAASLASVLHSHLKYLP